MGCLWHGACLIWGSNKFVVFLSWDGLLSPRLAEQANHSILQRTLEALNHPSIVHNSPIRSQRLPQPAVRPTPEGQNAPAALQEAEKASHPSARGCPLISESREGCVFSQS